MHDLLEQNLKFSLKEVKQYLISAKHSFGNRHPLKRMSRLPMQGCISQNKQKNNFINGLFIVLFVHV